MRIILLICLVVYSCFGTSQADTLQCLDGATYTTDSAFELVLCVQQIGYDSNRDLEVSRGMTELRIELVFDTLVDGSVFKRKDCDQRTDDAGILRCDIECNTNNHRSKSLYVQIDFQFDPSELVFSDKRSSVTRDRDQLYFNVADCRVMTKRSNTPEKPVVFVRYLERNLVERYNRLLQAGMYGIF